MCVSMLRFIPDKLNSPTWQTDADISNIQGDMVSHKL